MNTINALISVLIKVAIKYESLHLSILLIIYAESDRIIVLCILIEFSLTYKAKLKLALLEGDGLSHSCLEMNLLKIVLFIRCEHHLWGIQFISLLVNASVYPDRAIAKSINLELNLQNALRSNLL